MNNLGPFSSQLVVPAALSGQRASAMITPAETARDAPQTTLWAAHHAEPMQLLRTREGRSLSRVRYQRANEFMLPLTRGTPGDWPDFLYGAGIVAQLALSSHLIDVGFPDAWCARHIGLYVSRSLEYANATGLGLECSETARLAKVLNPYSKWNAVSCRQMPCPDDDGFTYDGTRTLLSALIDHVGNLTGHLTRRRTGRPSALLP